MIIWLHYLPWNQVIWVLWFCDLYQKYFDYFISVSICLKKYQLLAFWLKLYLIDQFGKNWHLSNINYSNQWTWCIFPVLEFIFLIGVLSDAEAETPKLWPPDAKIWLLGKDPMMLGKIEGRRRRGWQRIRWLDGITDAMDMSLSKPW